MKILIIQKKMIGDVLTSSVIAECLKANSNQVEIHYLIDDNTVAVVQNNPFIDRFVLMTPRLTKNKWRLFKFIKSVRAERYDVIIDVYSKISTNLISYFSGAKQTISQYKWYSSFIYTNTFKNVHHEKTRSGLAIENRLQLLKPLNAFPDKPVKPKIYLTENEKNAAIKMLTEHSIDLSIPLIMISVLGSSEEKTFPLSQMAKLLDYLAKHSKLNILFNYIPNQKKQALDIYNFCLPETRDCIYIDVYGKSLREFLAITSQCKALIGNEGGATNMAKALDIPTFTIFSPWISPEDWAVFEDGNKHDSVHLRSFLPAVYQNLTSYKKLRKQTADLYGQFKFDFFKTQLHDFLNRI
ncbi:MAG: glycosyltransferase family 9 protein [Bacteroidia bacterium]|nr:glycosyltransferase family 9 protein [Bacteroidia bacterium]MBT8289184.1 glycosyltransferase family 9 protein [Bacteroidia bacterium]